MMGVSEPIERSPFYSYFGTSGDPGSEQGSGNFPFVIRRETPDGIKDAVDVVVALREFGRLLEESFETCTTKRHDEVHKLMAFLMDRANLAACPASTKYHLSCDGGLVAHSVGVAKMALYLAKSMELLHAIPRHSVIQVGLFHDVGKVGTLGRELHRRYVPNVLKSGKVSDAIPYQHGNSLAMPIAAQSLMLVSRFVDLEEAEAQAILAHDGQYIQENKQFAQHETPLTLLIHHADMWCCRVLEDRTPLNYGFGGGVVSGESAQQPSKNTL
jgi:hypothetical protein